MVEGYLWSLNLVSTNWRKGKVGQVSSWCVMSWRDVSSVHSVTYEEPVILVHTTFLGHQQRELGCSGLQPDCFTSSYAWCSSLNSSNCGSKCEWAYIVGRGWAGGKPVLEWAILYLSTCHAHKPLFLDKSDRTGACPNALKVTLWRSWLGCIARKKARECPNQRNNNLLCLLGK